MLKRYLFATIALFVATLLFGQSNELLDQFLDRELASFDQSIWLLYLASGEISGDATPEQAMEIFNQSELSTNVDIIDPSRPIHFGEYAYFAMEILDLPAGFMYLIFPSPRYASKEFIWRGWIPGSPPQNGQLTPWDVTTSISEILTWKEARDA